MPRVTSRDAHDLCHVTSMTHCHALINYLYCQKDRQLQTFSKKNDSTLQVTAASMYSSTRISIYAITSLCVAYLLMFLLYV